ncbi:MAG: DUF5666 domain-containing protein, partial [Thiolinea sp.]
MKPGKSITSLCLGILLASCQGDTQLAEGGITGSGITMGPITAFGSVWVGGVRYDVSNAQFLRNGLIEPLGQNAFRVGEIVNIVGDINQDGVTGVAKRVEFDRNLSGLVTAKSTDGKTLYVLGQAVETDTLTLFSGFSSLSTLETGNVVEISGSRTPAGTWIASTISLLQSGFVDGKSELEVEGRISTVKTDEQTFKVGELTVNYSQSILNNVGDLSQAAGQFIEIKSEKNLVNGQLLADIIEPDDEYPQFAADSFTTLDGRITEFSNSDVFSVNGQAVLITENTKLVNGDKTDFGLNAHLSIEGYINSNRILEANEVTVRQSADQDKSITLEAKIELIDAENASLTLLGSEIITDTSTIILDYNQTEGLPINFEKLLVGNLIRVTGRKITDGKIIALRIDRNPPKQTQPETPPNGQDSEDTDSGTDNGSDSGTDNETDPGTDNETDPGT